ncbi:MAG: dolichyl-phosphate-mannose--protein mannosyltransferase [Nocardioidaceae bacterium]
MTTRPPTDDGATGDGAGGPLTAVALLSHTTDNEPVPPLRRRFTPLHYGSSRSWGWIAPLLVTIFVGVFQFWGLTTPHNITFDETYYAKDAYSLLVKHYASTFVDNPNTKNINEADQIINAGSTKGIFADEPNEVVHPDVGKWMIAAGEWLFGLTPLGWRFSACVTGTLMVLVMCRLVRRLTGSTLLGCVAGLLLGFDGLHFVMSRFALLDIFLAFWLLCATHCLVADRDWARRKVAQLYEVSPHAGRRGARGRRGFGPVRGFLLRPWRVLAGVCFGLAAGTKWSAIFVVAGLALLSFAWDCGMRRAIGIRLAWLKALVVDAIPAFFSVIVVGLVVYVVSWMGFLTHAQLFEDAFGHGNGSTWSSVDDHPHGPIEGALHDLDILWNYHQMVYDFHTSKYMMEATHPFQSNPGGWLLINRPLGVAATSGGNTPPPGCKGSACVVLPNCPDGQSCVRQVLAIGTPVLWWGGVIALIVGLGYWLAKRDWRFGIPIVGVLTTWLPWFRYDQRPIFFYYGVAIIPFTVIAVTLVLGKILGNADASRRRRLTGVLAVGVFVFAVAANFAYFYPILSDQLLTNASWNDRMWLTHWI